MPEFNGSLRVWLKYPAKAKEQGTAFINFTVNEDGSLSDLKIQRSCGYEALDPEAMRIVKSMPA